MHLFLEFKRRLNVTHHAVLLLACVGLSRVKLNVLEHWKSVVVTYGSYIHYAMFRHALKSKIGSSTL